MAIVFNDTFTDTAGTALTSHIPDTGSSWATGTSATSPIISGANRARTSSTGASDYVLANPALALSSHDYSVSVVVRWMASGGPGGATLGLVSHGGGGDAGNAVASVGYTFRWVLDNGFFTLFRNNVSMGGTWPVFMASAGSDYTLTLKTSSSGGNVIVTPYLQRNSDGFYLKSDGTFQSSQISLEAGGGLFTDTSPLSYGTGAFTFFEYAGDSVGVQPDTFTITTAGGPALSAGSLSATSNTPTSVGLSGGTITGGTSPYSSQLKRSAHGAGSYSNVGSPVTGASPTFTDSTVTGGGDYDYKYTVTDNVSASADSNVIRVQVPVAATQFAFTGPTSGTSLLPSSNFTLTPNGYVASATVALSDGGASGTFKNSGGTTITSLTFTATSSAQTFTYTAASAGTKTITPSTSAGSPSTFAPSSINYLSTVKSIIVFVGDSNFNLGTTRSVPSVCAEGIGNSLWSTDNRGIQGWTVANVDTDLPNWVNSEYDSARRMNIAIVMIGTNDLSSTGSTIYSALTGYISDLKAAQPGWKVGIVTIPYNSAHATNRDAYNALIKSSVVSTGGADFLIDATGDADLESTTDATYNDGLHLTDIGRSRLAAIILGGVADWVLLHSSGVTGSRIVGIITGGRM